MKIKFKPGPATMARTVSFNGFDGMKKTCVKYALKKVSGAGQAKTQLRCVKYKKGAGKPPCQGAGRRVKGRSPGLLRGSLTHPKNCPPPGKRKARR